MTSVVLKEVDFTSNQMDNIVQILYDHQLDSIVELVVTNIGSSANPYSF